MGAELSLHGTQQFQFLFQLAAQQGHPLLYALFDVDYNNNL